MPLLPLQKVIVLVVSKARTVREENRESTLEPKLKVIIYLKTKTLECLFTMAFNSITSWPVQVQRHQHVTSRQETNNESLKYRHKGASPIFW